MYARVDYFHSTEISEKASYRIARVPWSLLCEKKGSSVYIHCALSSSIAPFPSLRKKETEEVVNNSHDELKAMILTPQFF